MNKFEIMESSTLENIFEKKRWRLHALILLLSLLIVVIISVFGREKFTPEDMISLTIILFIQLELFISIGTKLFRDIKPGNSRKAITRIVLSRFAIFLVTCFVIALVVAIVFLCFRTYVHGEDIGKAVSDFFINKFAPWVKSTSGGLLFGAAIFIFLQWQDALKREQKLREENLIFQNETLKTQINPHFLFNNLNTLSSLIGSRPEVAEKFISMLSSIYRYITENSTKDRVTLDSELSFISEYFYLYRIRDEEKIKLDISIKEKGSHFILPVSLQILVENAIKHNKATREEPLQISVYLEDQNVVVRNNIQRMASQIRSTGIGLRNLSERVKLMTGKQLIIDDSGDFFTVKIPLLQ
jgi:two-component system LytT family sensor kinase